MAIYTNIQTGQRIKSTKNADGTVSKTVLSSPAEITRTKTKTSVGYETPQETLARARAMTAGKQSTAPPTPIESPVPAEQITPSPNVTLPTPEATNIQSDYFTSLSQNLANQRQTYESTLQAERDRISSEQATLEKERDRALEGAKDQLTPFREDFEKKQREQLYVNQNFEANQKLTNELETLLTEGNNLIRQAQGIPAAQSVVNARVSNAIRDVSARAGVIEAVISARNSQIGQAYTMIDRSVEAMTADRQDQLSYYETLLNLKNQDLLTLSKEDEKLANEQMNLAKNDLAQAEASANYVKEMLMNPATASILADAGVTLLDTPEQVNTKIAEAVSRQEVTAFTNELTKAGYIVSPVPLEGAEEYTVNGKTFYAKVRPGSMLEMERRSSELGIQQQQLQMEATRASIANTYDQIAARVEQSKALLGTLNGKTQTQAERTAEGYASRLLQAGATIDQMGGEFTGLQSYAGALLPNVLKSQNRQMYEQAQRNFVNAVLRRESGAVISDQEFSNATLQYFPQPGDSAGVVAQKKQNRDTVISNLFSEGNVQMPELNQQPDINQPLRSGFQGTTSTGLGYTIL